MVFWDKVCDVTVAVRAERKQSTSCAEHKLYFRLGVASEEIPNFRSLVSENPSLLIDPLAKPVILRKRMIAIGYQIVLSYAGHASCPINILRSQGDRQEVFS